MKRWMNRAFWIAALAVVLWGLRQSVVFVDETELVVVTNFGQIVAVYDQVGSRGDVKGNEPDGAAQNATRGDDRGLHWKLPWQEARRFDGRLQVFDPPAREMVTNSRNIGAVSVVGGNLTVACYICWRIPSTSLAALPPDETGFDQRPVVRFLRSVRGIEGAELRIDKLVRSKLGAQIATLQLSDLVNAQVADQPLAESSGIRELGRRVTESLAGLEQEAGIEVIDVQIKRLNLPEGNRRAVYARQTSERRRIADKYRSEGKAEATKIVSQGTRESQAILAQAYAEAQRIRGEGDAQATRTYAEAYSRDPEFFQWMRTLEAYENMLGDQTTLVLSADSKLLKLFSEGLPPLARPEPSLAPATQTVPKDPPRPIKIGKSPAPETPGSGSAGKEGP